MMNEPAKCHRHSHLHPCCTHGTERKNNETAGNLEEDGVPGQVRTANLPLRRGMLYPIELLGHKSVGATDGVHVNGRALFCHVVRRAF